MAVVNPPVWLEAGTYTASMDRLVTGLLIDRNWDSSGNLVSLQGGVVPPKDQLQVTANGTMNLTVSAGVAAVPRQALTPPGCYLCYNNAATTVTVPTQASNQRNDILVARVNDSEEGNTGDNWEMFLVPGSASTSPVDPTVPANYVKLARINVKSAALNGGVDKITSTQVTDLRTFVAAPGGAHPVWAGGAFPTNSPGRLVTEVGGQTLRMGDGDTWLTFSSDEARHLIEAFFTTQTAYFDNTVYKLGSASGNWDATPLKDSDDAAISPVSCTTISRLATFKITVGGLAKCDNTDISGNLGVSIRGTSGEIYAPAIGKGPSYYGTFWNDADRAFIAVLPSTYNNQFLEFRVVFRSNYTGSGSGSGTKVKFQRIRLIVEPIGTS